MCGAGRAHRLLTGCRSKEFVMTRKVIASATLAVLGSLAVAGAAFAEGPFGRGDGRYHDRHPMLWGVGLTLLLAAAAVLVTWLVLRRRPAVGGVPMAAPLAPVAPASPTASAESILAERLARSEISPDDYRAMLTVLRQGVAPPAPE